MIESRIQPTVRRAASRGHAQHGWLDSYHSFSFADYFDRDRIQYGALRVLNDDTVAAGTGFGMHGHRDMEIISYILDGELAHKDTMGNSSVIKPGDVQRMSAGTGVLHSEFNNLRDRPTHFLQIWVLPEASGLAPGYEQRFFAREQKDGRLCLVASGDGRQQSVRIHQDVSLYAGLFDGAQSAHWSLERGRQAYLHVATGQVTVNGTALLAGDAATFEEAGEIEIEDGEKAEVLLFDLAR